MKLSLREDTHTVEWVEFTTIVSVLNVHKPIGFGFL